MKSRALFRQAAEPATGPPSDLRQRLARLVTEVFAPAPVIAALLLAIAWASTPTLVDAIRWAALAILFCSLVPFGYILLGVRRRRFTDHHVSRHDQRPQPLLVALLSVMVGLTLLFLAGAPRPLPT